MSEHPFYRKYPKRPCPVCDSSDSRLLFRQEFSVMKDSYLLTGYDVVVCQYCGFCFSDRIPSQESFDKYYRDMSKYEYQENTGNETNQDLLRFRSISEFVMPFLSNQKARILDVGCATGLLLSLFKEGGYLDVTGIDPSSECKAVAKRMFDITVLNIPLPTLPNLGRQYDCIILSGVLEHIRDVKPVLALLRTILAEEGMIFIEVPNATYFAQWPDAPFQEFSVEHINFFSEISLQNLMHGCGFSLISSVNTTRNQTTSNVMPVITAIFTKTDLSELYISLYDKLTEPGLVAYINQSHQVDTNIQHLIDLIVTRQTPIIVWGVGTHTLRLMVTSQLMQADIRSFVDSNPHYQGKELNGLPIIAPHELSGRNETILISSRVYQTDIERQIRDNLQLKNEIIKLYEI